MAQSGQDDNDRTQTHIHLSSGSEVGHYRIIERIGAGGMGEVYLADDTDLDRRVALKFLPSHLCEDDECRRRFRTEAQSAARLSHPNIVTIHEVGEYQGRPYIVEEYVKGETLRQFMTREKPSLKRIVELMSQICDGLECAHREGVIHRDIKPSNIVIDEDGRPRIVDFGLAVMRGSSHVTKPGQLVGTSNYMSPEMIAGESVDRRSDIFSLGIILYELIAGRNPFKRDNEAATLNAIANEPAPPITGRRSGLPPQVQMIVDKALEKDRDMRYQHADGLKADLKRCTSGTITARYPTRRSNRVTVVGSLFILALVVVLISSATVREAALQLIRGDRPSEEAHVAVLPFANLTDVGPGTAFCEGLRETLTSRLTQMEGLQGTLWVVPASEITDRDVTSAKAAKKAFNVSLAVTGSVQELDGEIRLALNLVDTRSERQIGSEIIDIAVTDLPVLQDSAVSRMGAMLDLHLKPDDRRLASLGGTDSPEAYGAYLTGRGYLQRYEHLTSVDSAIARFREAIEFDSHYALAYAGLGEAFWRKYEITNEPMWVPQARGNSQLALALSDSLAPVHVTMGQIHRGMGEYQEAVDEYRAALGITPRDDVARRGLALAYEGLGIRTNAEAEYRAMIGNRPNNWAAHFDLALFYAYANRLDSARAPLDRAAALVPENVRDYNDIGGLYCMLGLPEQARLMLQRSLALEPNYAAYSNLGYLYYVERRYSEAAEMYEQAVQLNSSDHNVWANLASAYSWQPEQKHRAVGAYRRAIEEAEKSRSVNPGDPLILSSLAQYYAQVGDTVRARDFVNESVRMDRENTEVMVRCAFALETIGERDAAIVLAKRVLDLGYPASELQSFRGLEDLMADPSIEAALEKQRREVKQEGVGDV